MKNFINIDLKNFLYLFKFQTSNFFDYNAISKLFNTFFIFKYIHFMPYKRNSLIL